MGITLLHFVHVIALYTFVGAIVYVSLCQPLDQTKEGEQQLSEIQKLLIWLIRGIQFCLVLPMPQILFNVLGLTLYDTFSHDSDASKSSSTNKSKPIANGLSVPMIQSEVPHLCFRVVTRGLYPELVQANVRRNYLTCIESGLNNFSIEVVTDRDIHLSAFDQRIRQIVVPPSYRSSTGALFKARALQYALEPNVSPLMEGDYIVHLDEETLVTRSVVKGIVRFTSRGLHHFGQGLITYSNIEIVNMFTTLADSYRVADDMGKLRFQLAALHKPVFGWKGSFVVSNYAAERDVSFDHGPDGSIAEDCYFSMVAMKKGYTFDFVSGEMMEKSPFTLMDLIRQRKRWVQGIWLVVHSGKIPFRTKFLLIMSHYAWLTLPLLTMSYILTAAFGLQAYVNSTPMALLGPFCFAVSLYMYIFGLLKSFHLKKTFNARTLLMCLMGQIFTLPLNVIVENAAVVWGLVDSKHKFYIVKKQIDSNSNSNHISDKIDAGM